MRVNGARLYYTSMGKGILSRWTTPRGSGNQERLEPAAIDRLDKIVAPTLIIVGPEDVADMLTVADVLEQNITGAEKVVIRV